MTDYSKFDAALLAEITRARQRLSALMSRQPLAQLAEDLDLTDYLGYRVPAYRIFDRRLQALRRAGKIRCSGMKWEAIQQ